MHPFYGTKVARCEKWINLRLVDEKILKNTFPFKIEQAWSRPQHRFVLKEKILLYRSKKFWSFIVNVTRIQYKGTISYKCLNLGLSNLRADDKFRPVFKVECINVCDESLLQHCWPVKHPTFYFRSFWWLASWAWLMNFGSLTFTIFHISNP